MPKTSDTKPLSFKLKGMFACHGNRLMSVFYGIPFYRSSGYNSKYANTWFPFHGKTHDWIIKTKLNLPKDVLTFCQDNQIDKEITLKRFGTLLTICISASIGHGYWDTKTGKLLKAYLKINYPNYLLSDRMIRKIHNLQEKPQDTLLKNRVINDRLYQLGSVILLKPKHIRKRCLPEKNDLNNYLTNKNIHKALKLASDPNQKRISEKKYQKILARNTENNNYKTHRLSKLSIFKKIRQEINNIQKKSLKKIIK